MDNLFFALRLGLTNDGTAIQSVSKFDVLDDALIKYHQDLFGYIGKTKRILCMVVDLAGNVYAREQWQIAESVEKEA